MNTVKLIGNVGKEVNTKAFTNGKVTNFSIATNERYTNKENVEVSNTTWHNIVAFGKLADVCNSIVTKGKLMTIEGKLQYRTYQNKENQTVNITEIVAYKIEEFKKEEKA
jgi:single-strand DNA-binding protein